MYSTVLFIIITFEILFLVTPLLIIVKLIMEYVAIPISNLVSNEIYVHVKLIAYLISLKQYTGEKTLDFQ